jgi:hypothetical protein
MKTLQRLGSFDFSLIVVLFSSFVTVRAQAANTWYVSTSGSDNSSCSSAAAPCATFNGAYQKASGGDTIQVAGGTYSGQTLSAKAPTSNIIIQPASGATVTVNGDFDINGAQHVEIDKMSAGGLNVQMNSNFVTFRNVTFRGAIFYLGGSNISVIGGSIGPAVDVHSQIAPVNGWQGQGQNFLFDGVLFHDFTRTNSTVHIECLQVAGTTGMIIRNSKFQNCDVFDLSFTSYNNSGQVANLTLENNWFDTAGSGGYFAVNIQAMNGMLARFNSSTQGWVVQSPSAALVNTGVLTFTGNNIVGGILDGSSGVCVSASGTAVYNYNVTQGVKCGTTDKNAAPGFVNASAFNLNLASGSAAIDSVPVSVQAPSIDIAGNSRPQGSAYDAGASEFGSGGSTAVNPPSGLIATVQ